MPWIQQDKNWFYETPEGADKVYEALSVVDEYMQDEKPDKAEAILRGLSEKHSQHIEVFSYLSMFFEMTDRLLEGYLAAAEAVRIGLAELPPDFDWQTAHISWYHHENRPFLNAYCRWGTLLGDRKAWAAAIEILSRVLAVCPSDNLGVRYLLPVLWLEHGDIKAVLRHCEKFLEDNSPDIQFNYALALALDGQSTKAHKYLKKAEKLQPRVAKELRKKRHTRPSELDDLYVMSGGLGEAYLYWESTSTLWLKPEAQLLLLGKGKTLAPTKTNQSNTTKTSKKEVQQQKQAELIALTQGFCATYLDADYDTLCQKVILKLGRKHTVPFLKGKLNIWAAAIVHALGTANFLFDSSFEPHVTVEQIHRHFDTRPSTVSAKSLQLREMLDINPFNTAFMTSKMQDEGPLATVKQFFDLS